eukprot:GEMP01075966.1.p1 GENE.GEMP01075966.1~~GEMP01075966.1.p1  ORF type:complete len:111 (+),score=29.29 GEMP01075966.1:68-400(+)
MDAFVRGAHTSGPLTMFPPGRYAMPREPAQSQWPMPPNLSGFLNTLKTDDKMEASQPERKAIENVLTELRKEIPRLDDDAWMFKRYGDAQILGPLKGSAKVESAKRSRFA